MKSFIMLRPHRPPDKSLYQKIIFSYFSSKACCGHSKEPSHETVLLSTQNMFKLRGKKIITILS